MDIKSYLSGYADGEGCFCVSLNKSWRHKFGWEIRPSFSVSQNSDRAEVLEMLKQYFSCGTIRPDNSDRTLKYEVRSVVDLLSEWFLTLKKTRSSQVNNVIMNYSLKFVA